jgi:hypothetical protein
LVDTERTANAIRKLAKLMLIDFSSVVSRAYRNWFSIFFLPCCSVAGAGRCSKTISGITPSIASRFENTRTATPPWAGTDAV